MSLTISRPIPIFSPAVRKPPHSLSSLNFSKWNNANAADFNLRRRTQQDIETDIRRNKRFSAADRIADAYNKEEGANSEFRSKGSSSVPSRRSIPGKKSKYSEYEDFSRPQFRHEAVASVENLGNDVFRGCENEERESKESVRVEKVSSCSKNVNNFHRDYNRQIGESSKNGNNLHAGLRKFGGDIKNVRVGKESKNVNNVNHPAFSRLKKTVDKRDREDVRVGGDGVSFVMGNAPFEFRYSYTETPKVKPVRLREPPVAPFGPTTMPRPWTGRKPMSKKLLPEFDSFKLPPPHKKGVKPVQSPGPFLPGSGPKYVYSREEILGEPLTKEEIEGLVNSCKKSKRQMHIGRDGLTHNMLENIHAHWKRRRVCKIKCLGVCTVDMDNVYEQLEDKTGGKVIYGNGGVIYLFRGRNYNSKSRPRYPLMLWKPTTPVYPRLVKRVPDGLTLEEASEMRKKGRNLIPICKLGKNGVYRNLVENVREAFEACDLVRINCQGMNPSDCRKIGAKLKDLVPCVLISFEHEHILMWRGREWTSLLPKLEDNPSSEKSEIDITLSSTSDSEDEGLATSIFSDSEDLTCAPALRENIPSRSNEGGKIVVDEGSSSEADVSTSFVSGSLRNSNNTNGNENLTRLDNYATDQTKLSSSSTEGILSLLKEAIANGAAIVLDDSSLDSDIVFQTAVSLAKSAPRGPVYKGRFRKVAIAIRKSEKPKTEDKKVEEVLMIPDNKRESENKKSYRRQLNMDGIKEDYLDVIPQGSLRVDELAKLLA